MSWNVNGIRAVQKKGFLDFFRRELPEVLCLQEVKARQEQAGMADVLPKGDEMYWNPALKPGYSGTAVLTSVPPLAVGCGMGIDALDQEGRVITLEFADFYLVNVYTPNSQDGLRRLAYRQREWDPAFRKYVAGLARKKPVAACGDFNVAHREIDIARPKENERTAGFTMEEREGFSALLDAGFVDTFREFEKGPGHYSWWSYRAGARARNVGWRIDYFLVSTALRPALQNAWILPEVTGSDHCPVAVNIQV